MKNALYRVLQKGMPGAKAPLASDVNQVGDLLSGNLDAGALNLAASITAPSTSGITTAAATGTALGVGTYLYKFTFVTGNLQSDNTATISGETPGSASISVTTTTGLGRDTAGRVSTITEVVGGKTVTYTITRDALTGS